MSSDTKLAFAHPAERAEATAPEGSGGLRDRISLRDYILEVEIGAFQQERGALQRIKFNVVVEVAALTGPIDDDVDRILSYDRVTEAIDIELGAERLNLLETLAARVAERILLEPQALRVFVRIEKIDRGPYSLGVEIVREKGGNPEAAVETVEDPHPRVVYLSNAVMASDAVAGVIDEMAAGDAPVIFCVGAAEIAAPQAAVEQAQRRIDLLAIEQNAWVLAGRDKRCVVVGTMTELDWAMKNGQICVWAPSKMVLDAVDGPSAEPADARALAAWFANHMQACELVIAGGAAPDTAHAADVPVRVL
ncbi:dihydroneopterin aldolase [Pseudooctadecabacter jejudonensis]|uniref:D-erythro-7,8-dihydroneopterin triphosphate 2'-epimerase n=1 Tax=Pseudooctadecabacter jejudonensis TaxID=1391910 RepID=A0A1Y5RQH0_9RHOB|nr:dihydroneopterin aldolase [Pseudooctadecabacter jejudonensis]SLN21937.1 D-erythro-7,8-dihydroneopterin triphosphate 2'-epimerase [Pseudooctadecabacter jejudonensis]